MFLNDNVLLPYLKLVPIKKSKSSKISLDIPFIVKFVTQVIMQFGSQKSNHCQVKFMKILFKDKLNINQIFSLANLT